MEIKSVPLYIQNENLIKTLHEYEACILCDRFIYEKYEYVLKDLDVYFDVNEIPECHTLIGVGGGKILDIAKYEAYQRGISFIAFVTSCASDAPCSDVAVIDGKYVSCGFPSVVLADEDVLASCPREFLLAGIGDGLSTYYESRYYDLSLSMKQLAMCCRDVLLNQSMSAVSSHQEGLLSCELKECFEAILYMSGVVFANSGGSVTHALAYGFSEVSNRMHGILVSFSLLVQLFLENNEEIHLLRSLYKQLGLPLHLSELGVSGDDLECVVERAFVEKSMRKFSRILNKDEVIEAILMVDMFE